MARMGAGRKPPSSFPGILLAFPEGPLGATFSGGEVTETGRTSAHPSPPDAHWVKPGQQAWRRRRGAFPCRVFPCHLSSRAHWAHPRNCRGLQSIRFPHASLCSNNLEMEAPPKQIRVLNTAGMDLLFLTHAVRPPQNKVGAPPHGLGRALTPLRERGLGEDHWCPLGSGDKPSPLASLTPALGHPGGLMPVPPSFPQVEKLVKYLDPNDLGRINFKDFCRGVFAMKGEVFHLWLALHIRECLFCVFPIEVSPSGEHLEGKSLSRLSPRSPGLASVQTGCPISLPLNDQLVSWRLGSSASWQPYPSKAHSSGAKLLGWAQALTLLCLSVHSQAVRSC